MGDGTVAVGVVETGIGERNVSAGTVAGGKEPSGKVVDWGRRAAAGGSSGSGIWRELEEEVAAENSWEVLDVPNMAEAGSGKKQKVCKLTSGCGVRITSDEALSGSRQQKKTHGRQTK